MPHITNIILFGHTKEWNTNIHNNTNEFRKYQEKEVTKDNNIVWFHFYEVSRMGKSIEMKSKVVVAYSRRRIRERLLVGMGFFLGWGKCSKTVAMIVPFVSILNTTELCILIGWMVWYVNYISKMFLLKNNYKTQSSEYLHTSTYFLTFWITHRALWLPGNRSPTQKTCF